MNKRENAKIKQSEKDALHVDLKRFTKTNLSAKVMPVSSPSE